MNTQIPSELKKNKVSDTTKPPNYIKFSMSIHTYLLFIDMNLLKWFWLLKVIKPLAIKFTNIAKKIENQVCLKLVEWCK